MASAKPIKMKASETLTLRITHEDRALLDQLVMLSSQEHEGARVTAATFLRGLIRRAAKAKGLR